MLGFEVTERIRDGAETVAVAFSETESVTMAVMNRFGCFQPQNAHKNIHKEVTYNRF